MKPQNGVMRQEIDRSRLKVTSRRQIAEIRARRAHEREWREARRMAHLYRKIRLIGKMMIIPVAIVVGVLRALGVIPPL
ncbi:hypothetical protein [Nonomuraea sp. NPDC001023]|uniref:hypothetical protein n=1 Tax=unclassified Nonomuraea TaxID=2593643 RepID=UPI003319B432